MASKNPPSAKDRLTADRLRWTCPVCFHGVSFANFLVVVSTSSDWNRQDTLPGKIVKKRKVVSIKISDPALLNAPPIGFVKICGPYRVHSQFYILAGQPTQKIVAIQPGKR